LVSLFRLLARKIMATVFYVLQMSTVWTLYAHRNWTEPNGERPHSCI